MTGLLLAALVGALAAALAGGAFWLWRSRRPAQCPSCGTTLASLGPAYASADPDKPAYEVLVCPSCTAALTQVGGARSRFAWCPSCGQQTLETPCVRLPDLPDGGRRVEVHENCHLCGHEQTREAGAKPPAPAKRGQVLQFPEGGRRKR